MGRRLLGVAACVLLPGVAMPAPVRTPTPATGETSPDSASGEVVVRGARGSAIADVAPIATYDSKFIEGTGATSMAELLRILAPMARAADGSDPILLLNGQRTSGWEEIQSLPPEALAGTEILPESAAIRYGYPPTRRLLNFMTKPRFHQAEVALSGGQSTAGGAGSYGAHTGATRIVDKRRITLAADYKHVDALRTARRAFALDPDNLFDPVGNVVAADGRELDPALSAAAGHPILATGVPSDAASRDTLAAYLAQPGQLNVFDVRPYNTLIGRDDTVSGNAVAKLPIGAGIDGTFTLSAERSWGQSLEGYPPLTIFVPATNPYSPFQRDIFLYRFVADKPRPQHSGSTTLHAGAVVQGGVAGWQWDVTTALDETDKSGRGDRGYDPLVVDRAVAAGADPFGDLSAAMLGPRLSQQASVLNRKAEVKAVARGALLRLPAGNLQLVTTVEGGWLDAKTRSRGYLSSDFHVNQSRIEGGVTLEIPLASKRENVLPFLGELSANLTARVRGVRDYGTLHDTTYGLNWSPLKGLQFTATRNSTQAAPNIDYRSAATVQNLNVPFFDFGTGRSAYVTLITGANPDLAAERRRVDSYGFTLKPFEKSNFTISGTYSTTLIRDGSLIVSALTPETQVQLPDQFVRDAFGRLDTVILRPINFDRQRQRAINFQINYWTQLGKDVAPAAGKPAKPRALLYAGAAPYLNLRDRVELRPGLPVFDQLGGNTLDGSQYHFRAAIWAWAGLSKDGDGFSANAGYQAPSHIDGGSAKTDLHFGARTTLDISAFVWLRHWLPHADWLQKTKLTIQVTNPFDSFARTRDGNGDTPFRYQRALLDPQRRTVKITLRKLFQ